MDKFCFPKYIQTMFEWVFMNGFKLEAKDTDSCFLII